LDATNYNKSEIAIPNHAQWTALLELGPSGTLAQLLAEVECRRDHDRSLLTQHMEELYVQTAMSNEIATFNHVRLIVSWINGLSGVHVA